MWYLVFYAVGLIAGVVSPAEDMEKSLAILEPITLTALVASLLVPFAGFASNERWQRFALQYAIIPLFGIYSIVLWGQSSLIGLVLLISATAVHAGYWTAGVHSREYRLRQFELGFAKAMPQVAKAIAVLNVQGRSEEADVMITEIIAKELPQVSKTVWPACGL